MTQPRLSSRREILSALSAAFVSPHLSGMMSSNALSKPTDARFRAIRLRASNLAAMKTFCKATIGDEQGLFIVVKQGRIWFSTADIPATTSD